MINGHKSGDLAATKNLQKRSLSILRKGRSKSPELEGKSSLFYLPLTGKKEALLIAESLRCNIESCKLVQPDNEKIHITVSLAWRLKQGGRCSVDELLNKSRIKLV